MQTIEPMAAAAPVNSRRWYAINAKQESDEAEIRIFDVIGEWGITADAFVQELAAVKAKTINLRINSIGGEVFEGTAIYNALRAHPARIVVYIEGVAASAGSFIAMSGDEIRMADNAYLMMHNARGGVMGEADDMRNYAGLLEKINDNIAGIYERKSGKPRKHWLGLMDAETWFTAEEAKEEALIDAVYVAEKRAQRTSAAAAFDFKIYNKVPAAVLEQWGRVNTQTTPEETTAAVVVVAPPAVQQETSPMANDSTTQAAPAQTPAPANNGTPQGEPLNPMAFPNVQAAIQNFQTVAGPRYYEEGRKKGAVDASEAATARLKAIVDVCPGKPEMALAAFLGGQSPEAVKLAFDSTARAETAAREQAAAQQAEIARLNSLVAIGGYPGGIAMSMTSDVETASGLEPKAQATYEWDHKPAVRNGFTSKENYVNIRTAELSGRFRTQKA